MFNVVITPNAVYDKDLNFADLIVNMRFDNASKIIRCDNLDGLTLAAMLLTMRNSTISC